ncbi:unnamed protein product, partial [Amoebophrya sp. A120]
LRVLPAWRAGPRRARGFLAAHLFAPGWLPVKEGVAAHYLAPPIRVPQARAGLASDRKNAEELAAVQERQELEARAGYSRKLLARGGLDRPHDVVAWARRPGCSPGFWRRTFLRRAACRGLVAQAPAPLVCGAASWAARVFSPIRTPASAPAGLWCAGGRCHASSNCMVWLCPDRPPAMPGQEWSSLSASFYRGIFKY